MTIQDQIKYLAWNNDINDPYNLSLPWHDKGYTYITDGRLIARFAGDYTTKPNDRHPDAQSLDWSVFSGLTSGVEFTTAIYERLRGEGVCERCDPSMEGRIVSKRICPECAGAGEIELDNNYHTYIYTCQTCDGDGYIPGYPTSKCPICLGSRVWRCPAKFKNGVTIDIRLIGRAVMALGDITIYPQAMEEPQPFTFNGGVGFIMPLRDATWTIRQDLDFSQEKEEVKRRNKIVNVHN